jgi:hypothetical protein
MAIGIGQNGRVLMTWDDCATTELESGTWKLTEFDSGTWK